MLRPKRIPGKPRIFFAAEEGGAGGKRKPGAKKRAGSNLSRLRALNKRLEGLTRLRDVYNELLRETEKGTPGLKGLMDEKHRLEGDLNIMGANAEGEIIT